jgi:SAM-dependent methyltransferase
MNFGILHLAAPQRAVAESARVLRSGGVFGFTVWTPPSEALGFALVLQAIEQHGDPDVTLPAGPPFFKYSDPKVAQALMTEAHLSDLHCEKIALCWQLSSPAEFFSAFYRGTARTGGLLRAQPAERLERIEQEVERAALQRFGTGDGSRLEVPMPAMIYSARK